MFYVVRSLNKVWMAVAVATILATAGLAYGFMTSEANRKSDENLNTEIEDINSDLTSLQNRLILLNNSLALLSKGLDDLGADLELDIMNLQVDVSSLSTQISGLKSDISVIQTDITRLKSDVAVLSTQISDTKEDISAILTLISDLQSRVSTLEARMSALESERPLIVRIWFLSFEPDIIPVTGKDYLFDVKLSWGVGIESYVYGRTGHSRFIAPNYLDLSVGRTLMGSTVEITIFAYWHADDILIDINGNSADRQLTKTYTMGTVLRETVDGNEDGVILDPYDAVMTYKIETLP